jgi:transcription termination/antitermination protein NusG
MPNALMYSMPAADSAAVMREWFAVQVWSGREQLSARHLQQRGYEVFLPCYRERRQWSDRVKVIDRALFAGYVFCRLDSVLSAKIITAPGVVRIVGDHTGPLSIPIDEIDAIQRVMEAQLSAEPFPMPEVGRRVRIECGPLRGVEGVVVSVKNQARLVVSVSLLQRAVAVEVEAAWISSHAVGALRDH